MTYVIRPQLLGLGVPGLKSVLFLPVCLMIEMSTESALASRHTTTHTHTGARADTSRGQRKDHQHVHKTLSFAAEFQ